MKIGECKSEMFNVCKGVGLHPLPMVVQMNVFIDKVVREAERFASGVKLSTGELGVLLLQMTWY